MENERLPTTTELVQMLLQSFASNDGKENFGFVIATYEKNPDGGYFVGAGISTSDSKRTAQLTDALTAMFTELHKQDEEEGLKEKDPFEGLDFDPDKLGLN